MFKGSRAGASGINGAFITLILILTAFWKPIPPVISQTFGSCADFSNLENIALRYIVMHSS